MLLQDWYLQATGKYKIILCTLGIYEIIVSEASMNGFCSRKKHGEAYVSRVPGALSLQVWNLPESISRISKGRKVS